MKALVLDFGGVISRTMFETHADNEAALGLPANTLTWRGPFDPEGDALWQSMQAGQISQRDYWFTRASETGKLVGETWTSLPQFLQRIRGDNPATMIRPEFLDALQRAKAMDCKRAILSNELDLFYGAGFRQKLPFLAAFDLIVDATYTGILKPDPRSYAAITEGLGLAPLDCVLVDDQLKNIKGAQDFGMNTVLFDVTQPATSYAKALTMLTTKNAEPVHA
jgi:putative hydrolase of the HAD superfamily